jgi:hypothetical protein
MQTYNNLTLFEIARVKNWRCGKVHPTITIFDDKREKYVSAKTKPAEF